MSYKIFRITDYGWVKDIGYMNYPSYLEAERVVKNLKKSHKRTNYLIMQVY